MGDLAKDDRIRKEIISLQKLGMDVTLYVVFNDNSNGDDFAFEGCIVKSISLTTRNLFPSAKMLAIKALEFYLKVAPKLKRFDYVWCHEKYTILFPLISTHKRIIWDLHELPVNKPVLPERIFLRLIEKRAFRIIHANEFRRQFLFEQLMFFKKSKHVVLRNFPDAAFYESDQTTKLSEQVINWISGDQYVYLQGLTGPARFPFNSIAAVLDTTAYKIVVVGPCNESVKKDLSKRYGRVIKKRVLWVGSLPQLATPALIRNSRFSIILYKEDKPNNHFCEPNRLFQCLGLGVPVVVGKNPPMAEIVDRHSLGVVLDSDGAELIHIVAAINKLEYQYSQYKKNTQMLQAKLIWDHGDMIKKIVCLNGP